MRKIADGIVERRLWIVSAVLLAAIVCAVLIFKVGIVTDMAEYLPDDSKMKIGTDLMNEEFPDSADYSIRVMFRGLSDEEKSAMAKRLAAIDNVATVDYVKGDADYNKDDYTKYILRTKYDYESDEEKAIEAKLAADFAEHEMQFANDDAAAGGMPTWVAVVAVLILTVILIVMCNSWIEPFLFLFTIGIAVVINLGTNIIMGSISETTFSVAAILQLVLSMDYSIILTNRYRQECAKTEDRKAAMKAAVAGAFSSISSSSITTVVGLLALVFMSFKLGVEMGVVLAKGVFLSVICVFLVLPGLILWFSGLLEKTKKPAPKVPTGGLARFCSRFRVPLSVAFVLLFVGALILHYRTTISYTMINYDPVAEVFDKENQVVLLYENADDAKVTSLAEEIVKWDGVKSATNLSNTLGKQYTAQEMSSVLAGMAEGFDLSAVQMLYTFRDATVSPEQAGHMSLMELMAFLREIVASNPSFRALMGDEMAQYVEQAAAQMDDAARQMTGPKYSRLVITLTIPEEGEETEAFFGRMNDLCKELSGPYYLIGSAAMNYEMSQSFDAELLRITLLTAVAIFLVVLITFRLPVVPVILVLLVQCGVYITITAIGFQGYSINYLALLIVQCILMGSMIDYGILFSNYYREARRTSPAADALKQAYAGSIHTILTSGLIIVIVTAIFGQCFGDPTIEQICRTISIGAACAILLILFVLPGVLICFDRFTAGSRRLTETKP
ncbi:MAG: MMPL family transporter [Lachnospiraceae bacterium]|nr:MMPL family transporter [Lachnospiraceae bacterium]